MNVRLDLTADVALLADQSIDLYDQHCARRSLDDPEELVAMGRSLSHMAGDLSAHVGSERAAGLAALARIRRRPARPRFR